MTRSIDVDQLAGKLIRLLTSAGVRADRFTTGPGVAGINIWGEEGRYPITSSRRRAGADQAVGVGDPDERRRSDTPPR